MSQPRILVMEDEQPIRRGVVDALEASGYAVSEAEDGVGGLSQALRETPDLLLLDLMLPGLSGFEVLERLRKSNPTLPVIILTARGSEDDRVRGLRMGADDYVVKPFSARELLARVEAVLRRTNHAAEKRVLARLGKATIDLGRREILWDNDQRTELSETEAGILTLLLRHHERAVSREELLADVWGIEANGLETRTVDMHIARLRNKLREPEGNARLEAILTVRSHGYMAGPDLIPSTNGERQERAG